ncbi:MAG TPA: C26 family cysteine hydrolase domain-containing family [Candidatus Moranbacteria bacterium]|nr:C26 family cysteine hydrolase domain-containing family [Candidatus Moranbacteria bacterium]
MQILIVDLGSQYSVIIDQALREIGYRSAILPPEEAKKWLKLNRPKAIILSGGNTSVYEKNVPTPPKNILNKKIPVLGICYGMQWIIHSMGGEVSAKTNNEKEEKK